MRKNDHTTIIMDRESYSLFRAMAHRDRMEIVEVEAREIESLDETYVVFDRLSAMMADYLTYHYGKRAPSEKTARVGEEVFQDMS